MTDDEDEVVPVPRGSTALTSSSTPGSSVPQQKADIAVIVDSADVNYSESSAGKAQLDYRLYYFAEDNFFSYFMVHQRAGATCCGFTCYKNLYMRRSNIKQCCLATLKNINPADNCKHAQHIRHYSVHV